MATTTNVPESQSADSGRYPFRDIEREWQRRWAEADIYRTTEGGPYDGSEERP
jgi:hypothetical protein